MAIFLETMTKKMKIREAEANYNYQPNFSNLPFDAMSLIMSYLLKKDNIVASSVCKTWHEACVSVRVEDPIPWLLLFPDPDRRETYELYDSSLDKTYTHKVSSLSRYSYILYSTNGWLLMRALRKIFFFNPFTQDIIQMPCSEYFGEYCHAIAFSCAPTSNSCVVFAICNVSDQSDLITIKTCRVSTKVCTSFTFPKKLPSNYRGFKEIVFSNGVFYCLVNDEGSLGMFDLSTTTWDVLPPPPLIGLRFSKSFLTGYQGDIFLTYLYQDNLRPTIYLKLDLVYQEWTEEEEKSLGGFSFYLGFKSSLMVVSTQGMQQVILDNDVWIRPPLKCSHLKGY